MSSNRETVRRLVEARMELEWATAANAWEQPGPAPTPRVCRHATPSGFASAGSHAFTTGPGSRVRPGGGMSLAEVLRWMCVIGAASQIGKILAGWL